MKNLGNPVLQYLNLTHIHSGKLPTTPTPRRQPSVMPEPQSSTSHRLRASTTKAIQRSHTTQRISTTGLRFPHFPSIEITGDYMDSRRNEIKLFTTPVPRPGDYNIRPVHKYQHFDTFPTSYRPVYNSTSKESSRTNHPQYDTERKSAMTHIVTVPVTHTSARAQKTTTLDKVSPLTSNNKRNFFANWGIKVDDNDKIRRQEIQIGQFLKKTTKTKGKVPHLDGHLEIYDIQKQDTTAARYDNSRYIMTTTKNHPPQSPSLSNFYSDFRAVYNGQHPKPYQPAITFLDSKKPVQDANRRYSPIGPIFGFNTVYSSHESFQQKEDPFQRPERFNTDNQGQQGHSVNKSKNKISSYNYDPFAFNCHQKSKLSEVRDGFENEKYFVDFRFNQNNSLSSNSPLSEAEIGKSALPNRPDDTKYSMSVDPRQLFNNNFHVSEKVSVYSNVNDNFTPTAVTGGAKNYLGETKSVNEKKVDSIKEKRNLNTNANGNNKTENVLNIRSILFNNQKPGGYYIKVYNNDGNNYSIRDGKVPQKEVDGQHNVGSQNKIKASNNSLSMSHDHSLWSGSSPSVVWPESSQYSVWRNDKQWNQPFESQDFRHHSLLPFLNRKQ